MNRARAIGGTVLKGIILFLALLLLLLPTNRVWGPAYWFLLGLPLLVAGFRRDEDDAFLAWASYALAFVIFIGIRNAADQLGFPIQHDFTIQFDRAAGFGEVPTVRLQQWWYTAGGTTPFDWAMVAVHFSYYLAPPLLGVLLWRLDKPQFLRYASALTICYLTGALIHVLVPTAPPWYAALEGRIQPVNRIVYDLVHGLSPSFYSYGYKVAGGNEVAAVPSLHYATAHLAGLAMTRWRRSSRLGWAYAALMALALVYLGEHYLADIVAGGILAVLCWRFAATVRHRGRNQTTEFGAPTEAPGGRGGTASG